MLGQSMTASVDLRSAGKHTQPLAEAAFREMDFKYAMPFLLGLKGSMADNMGSVGINTTETARILKLGEYGISLYIMCRRRAVAQTFESLGQFSSSKDLSPINPPFFF